MKTIAILLSALLSWTVSAQHDHAGANASKQETSPAASFKDNKLGVVYAQYIQLKDALVASNGDEAKKGAAELQKSIKEIKDAKALSDAIAKFISASGLNEQRQAFSDLSNEMARMVKGGKLSAGALYLEYCPMANNNTGAYWLSNEKEIKNPYFGKSMLRCGSVKETIQ